MTGRDLGMLMAGIALGAAAMGLALKPAPRPPLLKNSPPPSASTRPIATPPEASMTAVREEGEILIGQRRKEKPDPAWETRLQGRLRESRITFGDGAADFSALVDLLSMTAQVPIVVDPAAQAHVPEGTLVTPPPGEVSVEALLDALTRQAGLTWILQDESIVITMPEEAKP